MNRQIVFSLLFSAAFFVETSAQNDVLVERAVPPTEAVAIRKGEVVDFQKLMRRFETAIKENDVPSAESIRSQVLLAMQKRVNDLEAEPSTEPTYSENLKQQREILQSVEKTEVSGNRDDQSIMLDMLRQLHRFEQLMQENFVTN